MTIATTLLLPTLALAQERFKVSFHGSARFVNDRGRVESRRLEVRDLIARCVGTNAFDTNQAFLLAYSPSEDSIQVVSASNGVPICDVIQFQTGASNTDRRRFERLAFVFVPDQTNAVGSAMILGKETRSEDRLNIRGQVQFVLASLEPGSAPPPTTGTNTSNETPTPSVPGTGGTTNSTGSGTNGLGNVPGLPGFPGLPGTTNLITTNFVSTNLVSTNLVTTNLVSTNLVSTNVIGTVPGLPPLPITTISTSTNVTGSTISAINVSSSSNPGTATPIQTSPDLSQLAQITSAAESTPEILTNIVLCTGNFSAGRRIP